MRIKETRQLSDVANLIAEARAGEIALLDPVIRRDRDAVDWLLHPDFAERGQSGRWWTREATINQLDTEQPMVRAEAIDLIGVDLTEEVVLITYVSVRGAARTGRCSVWMMHEGRMRIRWHQGTPVS